jgi:hypothetical protein
VSEYGYQISVKGSRQPHLEPAISVHAQDASWSEPLFWSNGPAEQRSRPVPDVLGGIGKEAWMTYARATDGTSTRWSFASPANGMYLWRAVDHEAEVLDVWVSAARRARGTPADAQAAQENNRALCPNY